MNYKRHKPRRKVRCVLCTDNRWGNSATNIDVQEVRARISEREQVDASEETR